MNIATLHLDTYKVVKLLQAKGYAKKEAEGFIEAIKEINLTGVATKQDIADLTKEIVRLENKLVKGLSDNLKFQIIQTIAIIGVMIALAQLP